MPFLNSILIPIWEIIRAWWWVLLPILLWKPLWFLWYFWGNDRFSKGEGKSMLVELKMPAEVIRPFKAMEQVYAGLWMLYDPPDFYEKWIEGKYDASMSIEITSIGGDIHFYLRFPEKSRNLIESSIYSQYPEVEIMEAEDYTKNVPANIPNKKWDLWGTDYEFIKKDVYPIKTYPKFFEERAVQEETERIDPLAALLEGMNKTGPGEQVWVQIKIKPITVGEDDYDKRAEAEIGKLANRPGKEKRPFLIKEATDVVLLGQLPGVGQDGEKEKSFLPPEMKLTPGERDVVSAIEHKVSKVMFKSYIRFIILGERDKWNKGNLRNTLGYFANFNTQDLNALKPWPKSLTKVHRHEKLFLNMFFHKTLVFYKKRKLLKRYIQRLRFNYPKKGEEFILNIEELATMFHFVGRSAVPAPSIKRVEAKKSEPPVDLPGE
ncbi:hypothetical protein KJ591_03115 [Patescibacteria group bacterium]|nr:hypothetical protein [Patescibacteria group bacterium]